jgi:hypothetical protein
VSFSHGQRAVLPHLYDHLLWVITSRSHRCFCGDGCQSEWSHSRLCQKS